MLFPVLLTNHRRGNCLEMLYLLSRLVPLSRRMTHFSCVNNIQMNKSTSETLFRKPFASLKVAKLSPPLWSRDHFHTQPSLAADFLFQCCLLLTWHTHTLTQTLICGPARWMLALCHQCGLLADWLNTSSATAEVMVGCWCSTEENTPCPALWMEERFIVAMRRLGWMFLCRTQKGKHLLVVFPSMCVHWRSRQSTGRCSQFVYVGYVTDCGTEGRKEQVVW